VCCVFALKHVLFRVLTIAYSFVQLTVTDYRPDREATIRKHIHVPAIPDNRPVPLRILSPVLPFPHAYIGRKRLAYVKRQSLKPLRKVIAKIKAYISGLWVKLELRV
jgi:hypothetical protein